MSEQMVGILVHGNNHFILSGPRPDQPEAASPLRHFSHIQIGAPVPTALGQWRIRNKELRENLEWAVIVPGDRGTSPGVVELLAELADRGVTVVTYAWI